MGSCFFCGTNTITPAFNAEVPVFRLTSYTHLGVARRFEYDKLTITVPRCPGCLKVHAKMRIREKNAIITGAITGFVLGIPTAGGAGITAVIGGFTGHWVSGWYSRILCARRKTKPLKRAILKSYVPIAALLSEGWRLDKPGGPLFNNISYLRNQKNNRK